MVRFCVHQTFLGAAVAHARLSEKGKPLVIMADGSAYLLNLDLRAWICVVDPDFAVSAFTSRLPGSQPPGQPSPRPSRANPDGNA